MALGKRLINTGAVAACTTDSVDPFGDSSGVLLYSFDYDASDASGSYDGTPTDVDFGVGGQINYGARFNGSSSKIVTTLNANGFSQIAISCWINTSLSSGTGSGHIVSANDGTNWCFLSIAKSTGIVTFGASNGGSSIFSATHTGAINDGNWHHVVGNYNGTNATLYIDNTGHTPVSATASLSVNTAFGIGYRNTASPSGTYYDGDIDQVRIFSSALTSDQVSTLWNNGDGETACVYTATTTDNYYPLADGSSDAVAYYKLDNSAEDSVGTNDGTESNIEYRFGRFGQAAVFNGSSSIITATQPSGLNGPCTYSAWLKTTSSSYQSIITVGSVTGSHTAGVNLFVNSGKLSCQTGNGSSTENSTVNSTSDIDTGNWVHCAVVVAGSTQGSSIKVYVNGQEEGSGTADNTAIVAASSESLCLGGRILSGSQSTFLNGSLDQVRIFTSALSASQVTELYNEKPETDTSTFKTVLWNGNSTSNYISNLGFQPDFVWIKRRNLAANHRILDSVRGDDLEIYPNLTNAEANYTTLNWGFEANGFSFNTNDASYNVSGGTYVGWCLKAGGDAVSNTDGTITSQVSANTDAGFSIVKYTGSGAAGMSFGHGLTSTPELVIIKNLSITRDWQVFDGSIFERMQFNTGSDDANLGLTITSSTIQTTQDSGFEGNTSWNGLNNDYIAYIWHSVSGVSKIGSYEGLGTSTVTVSDVGFKPSFIMIKNVDATANWNMYDVRRSTVADRANKILYPNLANSEPSATNYYFDMNDSGFVVSATNHEQHNFAGRTYLYMAFK